MSNKILLFLKVPPPNTGATLMNTYVRLNTLLKSHFTIIDFPLSYAKDVENIGKLEYRKLLLIVKYAFLLFKNLLIEKPDLIYFQITPTHSGFYRDCLYVLIIKLFRKKILFHMHGKGIAEASKKKINKWLYKRVFNNNKVICLSDKLVFDIQNVYKGRPYIVPNAIAATKTIIEKQKDSEKVNLLYLSNLFISKGILDYIKALSLLKNNFNINGFIVGNPGDVHENDLLQALQKEKLEQIVSFLGPLYGKEKEELYNKTDILIFPTLSDVWGLVILEAMQFGIPVIATNEGAISEIIDDGVTGFVVEKNNPGMIAKKAEILINDNDLRHKMGQAGQKKFLKKYTLDTFNKNMLNVFIEVFREIKPN